MTVQAGLCQTCSKITLLVFPRDGSFSMIDERYFLLINASEGFNFDFLTCGFNYAFNFSHVTRRNVLDISCQTVSYLAMTAQLQTINFNLKKKLQEIQIFLRQYMFLGCLFLPEPKISFPQKAQSKISLSKAFLGSQSD